MRARGLLARVTKAAALSSVMTEVYQGQTQSIYTSNSRSRRAPMVSPGPGSGDDDGGASTAAAVVVCCMCGDQGLPGELFQCAVCLRRLQHRYCSDQYPRMAAYSICNWCLRDKEVGGGGSPSPAAKALTARAKQRAAASSRLNGSRAHHDDKDQPCSAAVKKPKKSQERAAPAPPAAAKGTGVQTGG